MGIQIKNHFGAGPVRILVVSQTYRNLTGLENIGMDVVEIEDLYARKMDSDGEEFRNKFRIEKFFTVQNRDFTDLTNFLSSGRYDIIHFSLHAYDGKVFFTEKDVLSYDKFISAFDYIRRTKAVIFNICYSAGIAERISSKVPIVLGWEEKVTDGKAKDTSTSFYTPLFNGYPLWGCFRGLIEKPEANCKIFMNRERPEGQKKTLKKFRLAFFASLVLFLMIMTGIFLIKNGKVGSPGPESDSLQIISPVSGSEIVPKADFILSARLRPGGTPWIFVLPPAGKEWWPQYEGHLTERGNWEFPVLAGNASDTGQFTIVAMVIKDQTAEEMKAWLASQGTPNQSDPLSNEILKSFFWYASDTVVVTRVIE